MLSRDLELLHALFSPHRRSGMPLDSEVVGRVCDAIKAMTRQAMELEAACLLAGVKPQGGLPDGVTVMSLEALRRQEIPPVVRLNAYEDGAGDPDPGDAA